MAQCLRTYLSALIQRMLQVLVLKHQDPLHFREGAGLVLEFRGHPIGLQVDGVLVDVRLDLLVILADDADHFPVLAAIVLYLFNLVGQTIKSKLLLLDGCSQLALPLLQMAYIDRLFFNRLPLHVGL
jgi:hypothetical protein